MVDNKSTGPWYTRFGVNYSGFHDGQGTNLVERAEEMANENAGTERIQNMSPDEHIRMVRDNNRNRMNGVKQNDYFGDDDHNLGPGGVHEPLD